MDVADGAELVGVVGRAVIDNGEFKLGFRGAVLFRPLLKMAGELGVRNDINAVNAADGREVVEYVLDIGLPATGRSGLGWVRVSG